MEPRNAQFLYEIAAKFGPQLPLKKSHSTESKEKN